MFLFLTAMVLLMPVSMMLFGLFWRKNPPKSIKSLYGYRTARSMKSQEAWNFAQQHCAKIWRRAGVVLFFVSLIAMMIGKDWFEAMAAWLIFLQVLTLCLAIFPTERALKRQFDAYGNKKVV